MPSVVAWGDRPISLAQQYLNEYTAVCKSLAKASLERRAAIEAAREAERRRKKMIKAHIALGIAHLAFLFVLVEAAKIMVELWR